MQYITPIVINVEFKYVYVIKKKLRKETTCAIVVYYICKIIIEIRNFLYCSRRLDNCTMDYGEVKINIKDQCRTRLLIHISTIIFEFNFAIRIFRLPLFARELVKKLDLTIKCNNDML